ncbi:MAG: glycosyltransferase [Candidatus Gribaldobacteria bacterium]|nr:glycosyltransferase [Candidatus Gribaldobacteria bacterium]
MIDFIEILTYTGTFAALYFGILIFITLAENRQRLYEKAPLLNLPSVSIILPCFNEENNVEESLISLINLDYPKDKLEIIAVDDGSSDGTLDKILAFQLKNPTVKALHKENGGKHTALNLAIPQATGQIIGTLDADCLVEPNALKQMLKYFHDPKVMAVVSTIKVRQPKTLMDGIQYAEFIVSGFAKKIISFLGGLTVTPGPLSLFRQETFTIVGPYRKAHLTEDLEMALRLQSHNMKIACSWEASVYTKGKPDLKSLSQQRIRWQRGFLLNLKDYSPLLNFRAHGNLSFLLIYSLVGIFLSVALMLLSLFQITKGILGHINEAWLIKFDFWPLFSFKNFDLSWIKLTPLAITGFLALALVLGFMLLGRKYTFEKGKIDEKIFFWILLYPFLNASWWILTTASMISGKEMKWHGNNPGKKI